MSNIPFYNPFSSEGEDIVRSMDGLDNILETNTDILDIIRRTPGQPLDKDELIPKTYGELALKRIEWYIQKRYNKKFEYKNYAFLFNPEITQFDVISFYILAQAVAIHFEPKTREYRLFIETQGELIENRLRMIKSNMRDETLDTLLSQLLSQYSMNWTSFRDLIDNKLLKLTDMVIDNGEIIIEREDFTQRFEEIARAQHKRSEQFYDALINEEFKQMIIARLIMQSTENYMVKVHTMTKKVSPHENITRIAELLTETIKTTMSEATSYFASGGFGEIEKGSPLIPKAFPPCIQNTLNGVKSGNRNDAIVLLLTSFLSYARLYPGIFRDEYANIRISDIDPELISVNNEILPLIYHAADNCSPPLFEDDPQEKLNVIAKLGFGVHEEADLNNEGETTWYTPMSCEKIKIHLSSLCREDKICKKVGNPLSYYNRRKWIMKRENKNKSGKDDSETNDGKDTDNDRKEHNQEKNGEDTNNS